MRIEVEVTEESFGVNQSDTAICARVIVDGKSDFALQERYRTAIFKSKFDKLWDFIGQKIKKEFVEKQ